MKSLTEASFQSAADELGVEPAVIKAVCDVEAPKGGFLPDGRVTILFERHKFHQYTGGVYSKAHPDISNPRAGGYGAAGAHQWDRFDKAAELDSEAAMKSASWGKFQIMGFNYEEAGFDSLDAFVDAMKVSEDEQLKAFVQIVKSFGLVDELRNHNWAGFARGYNGANYQINQYDKKLKAAYLRHKSDEPESGVVDTSSPDPTAEPVALSTDMPGDVTIAAVAGEPDKVTPGDIQGVVTGHSDTAKSIITRGALKIAAFWTVIWESGIVGRTFLIVITLVTILLVAYELNKYWPKIKPWAVKTFKGLKA